MSKHKNNKYNFFYGDTTYGDAGRESVLALESQIRQVLTNKFYNLWMNRFTWEGLDEENKEQEQNYICRKLWSVGTVAAFKIKNTDLLGFAPYAVSSYNMYDFPATVNLVNERGVSQAIIPQTTQEVNKDVVLGWCQPNHKGIYAIAQYYIDRMVQVALVLNTNLQLQKMPWLIGVDEVDEMKMKDIVKRILNNETVVFASMSDLQRIQTLATNTPYIIDKLEAYQADLEKEFLTFLGVDNGGDANLEQTHVSMDAVNANNGMINAYGDSVFDEITRWLDQVNRVLGRNIKIKKNEVETASIHEEINGQGGTEDDK